VVPKVCSADSKGLATSSQEIGGCISEMATLKFNYFLIEGINFRENLSRNFFNL
jgi:hypothetical protein